MLTGAIHVMLAAGRAVVEFSIEQLERVLRDEKQAPEIDATFTIGVGESHEEAPLCITCPRRLPPSGWRLPSA